MPRRDVDHLGATDREPLWWRLALGLALSATMLAGMGLLAAVTIAQVGDLVLPLARRSLTSEPPPLEVACLTEGVRFPASFLDGPSQTRDEFLTTALGSSFDDFFTGSSGEAAGRYHSADGFSVVSDDLVLGYTNGSPVLLFRPTSLAIASYPACSLTMVVGEAVAARWTLAATVDHPNTTELFVTVAGDGCLTATGVEALTALWGLDVVEDSDSVEIIIWTRQLNSADDSCAPTGITLTEILGLNAPLGSRALLDAGSVPVRVIDR